MFKNNFGKIILSSIVLIGILLWCLCSFKTMLMFIGTFSLLMFINIIVTALCNALIGRELPIENDIYWRIFFIFITCICYSICFI